MEETQGGKKEEAIMTDAELNFNDMTDAELDFMAKYELLRELRERARAFKPPLTEERVKEFKEFLEQWVTYYNSERILVSELFAAYEASQAQVQAIREILTRHAPEPKEPKVE